MLVKDQEFLVGADPELFVGEGGCAFPAHGLIQGSKDNPFGVEDGAVQVDGLALEFNIDPASDENSFKQRINGVKDTLAGMIGDKQFLKDASVFFTEDQMKDLPLEALLLGCDEDYNGWSCTPNEKPNASGNMRTAGGHVHIGGFHTDNPFTTEHFLQSAHLAKLMDEQVGVYSILWDHDDKRREMYGKAGAFRPKTYGMEYRTLSNAWIWSEEIMSFVYNGVRDALERMFDSSYKIDEGVQNIINTSDRGHPFFKNNDKADQIMAIMEAS